MVASGIKSGSKKRVSRRWLASTRVIGIERKRDLDGSEDVIEVECRQGNLTEHTCGVVAVPVGYVVEYRGCWEEMERRWQV